MMRKCNCSGPGNECEDRAKPVYLAVQRMNSDASAPRLCELPIGCRQWVVYYAIIRVSADCTGYKRMLCANRLEQGKCPEYLQIHTIKYDSRRKCYVGI